MSSVLRRAATLALCGVAALALVAGWGSTPADATSYRFWSYWSGGSDWTFASQGASRRPADGAVEGWRFAISEASSSATPPRHSPSFARLCSDTDPVEGSKRVGLVIDPGTSSDAPDGETPSALVATCVVVPVDANGYDVLVTAGAQLRTDGALICGINGYPAAECGVPVADPAESDDDPDKNSGGGSNDRDDDAGGSSPRDGPDSDPSASPAATDREQGEKSRSGDQSNSRDKPKDSDATEQAQPSESALAAAAPAAAPTSTPGSGSPVGLLVGALALAGVVAAAWVVQRRRP
jgi:hypothetical protein